MTLSPHIQELLSKNIGSNLDFAETLGAVILVVDTNQKIQFINQMVVDIQCKSIALFL